MITVAITARNEASGILDCLSSLQTALETATQLAACGLHGEQELQLAVILNDCTDHTEQLVATEYPDIEIIHTSGGIVEAQRAIAHRQPFVIFTDADILFERETLYLLVRTMLDNPELQVAYPQKRPIAPVKRSLSSDMLYSYNLNNGFQVHRPYFNGKCFAIRGWSIPTQHEVEARASKLPHDIFLDYKAGMRVDDIYLSRVILSRFGTSAIREVPGALIWYRPPATLWGMYQTYKRMRVEFERMDNLFPEFAQSHVVRARDEQAWHDATVRERLLYKLFQVCLKGCHWCLSAERWLSRVRDATPAHWPAIPETKQSLLKKRSTAHNNKPDNSS